MADNETLAGMLSGGTKDFLEYLRRSGRGLAEGGGAAVDWLAGGAKSGAEPTLAMMQPGAADQPFLPTADSGGRLGALASALSGPAQAGSSNLLASRAPPSRRPKNKSVPPLPNCSATAEPDPKPAV